jgi:hypothetical protein
MWFEKDGGIEATSQFVRRRCFWLEFQKVLNRVELVDMHPSYDQVRLKLEFSAEEPDAICLADLRITGIFCNTEDE